MKTPFYSLGQQPRERVAAMLPAARTEIDALSAEDCAALLRLVIDRDGHAAEPCALYWLASAHRAQESAELDAAVAELRALAVTPRGYKARAA